MRYLTIVLAALSLEYAIAQPAHHRHNHKARRNWQDVDFVNDVKYDFSNVDFTKVDYSAGKKANSPPAPVAPAENTVPVEQNQGEQHAEAAAPNGPKVIDVIPIPAEPKKEESNHGENESHSSESQQSGSSGIVSGATGGAKGSFGGRTQGKAGATVDGYHGNVGVPYGSNMMFISTSDIDKYKYTNTFKNTGSNPLPLQIWNKGGRNGDPQSGMASEPNMKFTLQPGESQTVAFDENTLAAFSRQCDRNKDSNIPECVWGELTFGGEMPAVGDNKASGKWSGFNRSSIPAGGDEILTMSCTSCANQDTTSAKGKNEWKTPVDTPGRNGVPPGPAHLLSEMSI
ncbi:MAG: hypothetical protein Q9209_000792 [Squamulea sp. 1 TL-2023]